MIDKCYRSVVLFYVTPYLNGLGCDVNDRMRDRLCLVSSITQQFNSYNTTIENAYVSKDHVAIHSRK